MKKLAFDMTAITQAIKQIGEAFRRMVVAMRDALTKIGVFAHEYHKAQMAKPSWQKFNRPITERRRV